MDKQKKISSLHESIIRGGFFSLWVAGLVLSFYNMIGAAMDTGFDSQTDVRRSLICLAVAVIAMLAHGARMIWDKLEEYDDEGNRRM